MICRIALASLLAACSLALHAEPATTAYAGAAYGHTDYDLTCAAGWSCDDFANSGGKLYAGTTFSAARDGQFRNSVEAVYYQGGAANANNGTYNLESKFHALGAAYRATFTFGLFEVNGRIGVAATTARQDMPTVASSSKTKFDYLVGVGAAYRIDDEWAATLDVDHMPVHFDQSGKADVTMYTLGLRYNFK